MSRPDFSPIVHLLSTELGWMALVGRDGLLVELTFGHHSPDAALRNVGPAWRDAARIGRWNHMLARRLRDYAAGRPDDFADVPVDPGDNTPAQRHVLDLCRMIPYGQTITYGELARQAGLARAARFVGNCMARNRVPLIIPCHRVVPAGCKLGRYSAAGGTETKRRLLAMEAGAYPIISM